MIELLLQAERALSVGLLDRAEALYRQVAEADPRNSIAVVGLARVALERGGETEALGLARRALKIDPDNAAAQRMVQRLEEVISYRGDIVPTIEPAAAATAEPAAAAATEPATATAPDPVSTETSPPTTNSAAPVPAAGPHPTERAARPSWRRAIDRLLRRG